jgi:hypothetical protein
VDRRAFLQAGVAASLAGGAALRPAGVAARTLLPRGDRIHVHKVLVDSSLPESVAFGKEAARQGISIRNLPGGDVSDYWYDELDQLWRQRRAPIAGLTRYGPLFVLEQLAWDRQMRVTFRGEHSAAADGHAALHRLSGPEPTITEIETLLARGAAWTQILGNAAVHCRRCPIQASRTVTPVLAADASPEAIFFSWVIS